jgi:hypothetical protein
MPRDAQGNAIVASKELRLDQLPFVRVSDGQAIMNVNGTAAGTPVVIWNGESAYWIPSDQGSEETHAAYAGTNGWDSSPTTLGQDSKFTYGSNQDITAYDTLSFWMQPKAYPAGSDLQVLWKTTGGTTKGSVLSVEDYVANMDLDAWQRVEIPIADFLLSDDVDKVLIKYASKGGQEFWFDDIELNTSAGGGPYTYRAAAPDANTRWHLRMAVLMLAAPAAGWDHDAFANIAGGLANGLLLRHYRISTAATLTAINSKNNIELFGRFHPQDDITFADSVLQVGFMLKPGDASLVVTDDDVFEFIVRDNLSTISEARAFFHFGEELI